MAQNLIKSTDFDYNHFLNSGTKNFKALYQRQINDFGKIFRQDIGNVLKKMRGKLEVHTTNRPEVLTKNAKISLFSIKFHGIFPLEILIKQSKKLKNFTGAFPGNILKFHFVYPFTHIKFSLHI